MTAGSRIDCAFVCHPYHRGGVTRWMVDAACEWKATLGRSWFVTVDPQAAFDSAGGRPTNLALIAQVPPDARPEVIAPSVDWRHELGTVRYRAAVYAESVEAHVPAGVPVVVSDDDAAWLAGAFLRSRNPMIGVLHSDDEPYYVLAERHRLDVSHFVCVSRRIKERMLARCDIERARVAVIPCGIPVLPPRAAVALGQTLRIVWVGRIDERQKRVSDLVRIASALVRRGVSFRLTVVGGGFETELGQAVIAAKLREHVEMIPWLDRPGVVASLQASDLLLLPSNFEGWPIVVMEALACGCGVVSSRVSGVEDYEDHALARDCLALYPVGDVEAACRCVVDLAKRDPERRAASARRIAVEHFGLGPCVHAYAAMVRERPGVQVRRAAARRWWHRRADAAASYAIASLRWIKRRIRQEVARTKRA